MLQSSSLTFFWKYIFTPVWGVLFIGGFISSWADRDQLSTNFPAGLPLLVGCALVWLILMMIRLRRVEANEENFVIKTFRGNITLDYKEIDWISQIAMVHPVMISLKYTEKETGISKKILIMPSMASQLFRFNFLAELELTTFIRDKIIEAKPEYSKEQEPSRWLPVGLIFLTFIPFIIFDKFFFSIF